MEKIKNVDRQLNVRTEGGIYSDDNKNRAALTVYWNSVNKRTAIAIGINPSKANDTKSDKTLTTLARFLDMYGYCKFEMFNIFESYSTDQKGIEKTTTTRFSDYEESIKSADSIFIVWGVADKHKDEKDAILQFLQKYNEKIYCIRNEKGSSPIHPSRMKYSDETIKYQF